MINHYSPHDGSAGVTLDCCQLAKCSSHPQCAALGLLGDCVLDGSIGSNFFICNAKIWTIPTEPWFDRFGIGLYSSSPLTSQLFWMGTSGRSWENHGKKTMFFGQKTSAGCPPTDGTSLDCCDSDAFDVGASGVTAGSTAPREVSTMRTTSALGMVFHCSLSSMTLHLHCIMLHASTCSYARVCIYNYI